MKYSIRKIFHPTLKKELYFVDSFKINHSFFIFNLFFDNSNKSLIFDFNTNISFSYLNKFTKIINLKHSFNSNQLLFINTNRLIEEQISNDLSFSPLLNKSLLKGHKNSFNLNRLKLLG